MGTLPAVPGKNAAEAVAGKRAEKFPPVLSKVQEGNAHQRRTVYRFGCDEVEKKRILDCRVNRKS